MLAIRLARVGAKKMPSYRVVVIDKRRPRDSRSVEIVGHYNPTKDPILLSLDRDRIQHWIQRGAQPSDTVRRLMDYKHKTEPGIEGSPHTAETSEPSGKEALAAEESKPADDANAKAEAAEPAAAEESPASEEPSS